MGTQQTSASTLGERILSALSRPPEHADYAPTHVKYTLDNALALLCRVFPDFPAAIQGKEILDFGCGNGFQSVALAKSGARYVVGVEIDERDLEYARGLAKQFGVAQKTDFIPELEARMNGRFDLVLSKDSMEHFREPEKALMEMKRVLRPSGRILITFGPPWLAPYGAHMHFFTRVPWVHLLFIERTVLQVRSRFRHDGATRYEDVEGGLNRMSVSRFERIIARSGLKVEYRSDEYVKGIRLPGNVFGLREFLVNQVSCILTHA